MRLTVRDAVPARRRTGETYIGKGKHPQWLKDKLATGHSLDEFRSAY